MSIAFLITIPLMLLAVVVAVAPVLVVSIREHRSSTGQRSRIEVSAPRGPAKTSAPVANPDGDERATVVMLEEAAIAVNRLRSRRESTTGSEVDESLLRASNDLHRALVSLGDVGR
jgi:hypothetical protein